MATSTVAVARMKVAAISRPGGDFEIVDREIPKPGPREVRIKVQACGVCHSDVFVKEGLWPGLQYPRVPGHEVAGVIDQLGAAVTGWEQGQRVGVGWHGGQDNTCVECRRGRFLYCRNQQVPGISYDGGYQQYMVAPVEALAAIPHTLSDLQLITRERGIHGSAVGTPTDSEDTMKFAALTGVRPMIETYPLEKAAEAYARMMSGKAKFRAVLTM